MGLSAEVKIMDFKSDSPGFGIPSTYWPVVEGTSLTILSFVFLCHKMEIIKVSFRNVMIHKITYFSVVCGWWQVLNR